MRYTIRVLIGILLASHAAPLFAADDVSISEPAFDAAKGVWRYKVTSPFQKGENAVEVLLPDDFRKTEKYRVLYVLPVETGIGGHYGDGLQIVRGLHAHNEHHWICVQMSFDTIPWFGDHATDPHIRQEQYLKNVVIPLIEQRYPTKGDREGRILLGFSKSGFGAFTLIFRNPDFFGYASAWDSPLMLLAGDVKAFGIIQDMGTSENFFHYLPSLLATEHAADFRQRARLVLLGHAAFGSEPAHKFRDHTAQMHELFEKLQIRHAYDNTLHVPHTWAGGWVKPAIEALAHLTETPS